MTINTGSPARSAPVETPTAVRVLLADDHRMLREGLSRSLREEGLEVVGEAEDGAQAVDLALSVKPDVVLMDVTMPEMGGVQATKELQARAPGIKVVMLTMHADDDVLQAALAAGASGYLVKDCSTSEITAAVRMAAAGTTAVSQGIAASMLDEVHRLDDGSPAEPSPKGRVVTSREEEVLQLIADGCSTPEVAERLYISQKTVKNHLSSIYQKLEARDRTQAVLRAVRMGIVHLR